jgi:P27 family predicted phage terminase small subunit
MPSDMDLEAKKVWARVMRDFGHTGILTAVDADAFRVYCEAASRYQKAAVALAQSGPLVRGRDGNLVRNPLHQIVRDNAIVMRAFARELGFVPAAREGLTVREVVADDPLEAWAAR